MQQQKVKVIVLRTAGTNCDAETAFAFKSFGADVELVHINRLLKKEIALADYHILAIPGGFTYGDDIISGRILANELRFKLGEDIKKFIRDGKLIIGICNGFQILVRAGILPGSWEKDGRNIALQQTATLTYNDSGRFEDRWIHLRVDGRSVWTEGLDKIIYLPVAHGEGKFMTQDQDLLKQLQDNDQVIFRYCTADGKVTSEYPQNPNGSVDNIAGITDATGRILGLMPHPERHFLFTQHPFWTRLPKKNPTSRGNNAYGAGAKIFANGIRYVQEKLLNGHGNHNELISANKN